MSNVLCTEHYVYLGLPEVVHHGQHHEDGVIGGAGGEGSQPNCQVLSGCDGDSDALTQ